MEDRWREYFHFLDQIGELLEQLTELTKQKTEAARRADLPAVEACMKKEQAYSLNLRGMDRKRDKLLAGLGISGVRLSGLSRACPPLLQNEARETAERLHDRYQVFRSAQDVARHTLECNLHQMEKITGVSMDAETAGRPGTEFIA